MINRSVDEAVGPDVEHAIARHDHDLTGRPVRAADPGEAAVSYPDNVGHGGVAAHTGAARPSTVMR
jgi:hypothetical protein